MAGAERGEAAQGSFPSPAVDGAGQPLAARQMFGGCRAYRFYAFVPVALADAEADAMTLSELTFVYKYGCGSVARLAVVGGGSGGGGWARATLTCEGGGCRGRVVEGGEAKTAGLCPAAESARYLVDRDPVGLP